MSKPVTIVTVYGTTTHFEQIVQVAGDQTTLGRVVLIPFNLNQTYVMRQTAVEMDLVKLKMSSLLVIVTIGGYVGNTTKYMYDCAVENGIPIVWASFIWEFAGMNGYIHDNPQISTHYVLTQEQPVKQDMVI